MGEAKGQRFTYGQTSSMSYLSDLLIQHIQEFSNSHNSQCQVISAIRSNFHIFDFFLLSKHVLQNMLPLSSMNYGKKSIQEFPIQYNNMYMKNCALQHNGCLYIYNTPSITQY